MKCLFVTSVLLFPILLLAQGLGNVEVNKEMKLLEVSQNTLYKEIKIVNQSEKRNGMIVDARIPRPSQLQNSVWIVDGEIITDRSCISELRLEDIESIAILKDGKGKYIYGKAQGTFFITLCSELECKTSVLDRELTQYLASQPSIDFFSGKTFNRKNAEIITEWNSYYRSHSSHLPRLVLICP